MYKLECPYCEEEFEIDYFEGDSFELECLHCGKDFKVEVEFEPRFIESKFNFVDCEECNRAFDREYSSRNPMPNGYNSKSSLCDTCWFKLMQKEYASKEEENK